MAVLSTIAAVGFAALFVHGWLVPYHPYRVGYGVDQKALRRRLTIERWIGGVGFIASLILTGASIGGVL